MFSLCSYFFELFYSPLACTPFMLTPKLQRWSTAGWPGPSISERDK